MSCVALFHTAGMYVVSPVPYLILVSLWFAAVGGLLRVCNTLGQALWFTGRLSTIPL